MNFFQTLVGNPGLDQYLCMTKITMFSIFLASLILDYPTLGEELLLRTMLEQLQNNFRILGIYEKVIPWFSKARTC